MELFSRCGQVATELDRAVPIATFPAIHVVQFHAATGRIAFSDLDDPARGGRGGGADGRDEHGVRLSFAVISDASRRIACWHLRTVGGCEWRLRPLQTVCISANGFALSAASVDDRNGERCFPFWDGAHREHEVRGAERDMERCDLRRGPNQWP